MTDTGTAPARPYRGTARWIRVLVAIGVDLLLVGLALLLRGDDPYLVMGPTTSVLAWIAALVVSVVVALAGPGRAPVLAGGFAFITGALAFAFGPGALVSLYREATVQPVSAEVVTADTAAGRVTVRLPGGDTARAWSNGGGPTAAGATTTVYADPAGVVVPDTGAPRDDGAARAYQAAGVAGVVLFQVALVAMVVRRRDGSVVAHYSRTPPDGPGPARPAG